MSKETVYTEEVTTALAEKYQAAQDDEARAEVVKQAAQDLQVKEASVRAKLVNLGIYKAKERTTKTGEKIETKAEIVAQIAKSLGVQEDVVDSLEKATKPVLKLLRAALKNEDLVEF